MNNVPQGVPLTMPNQLLHATRFEIWSGGKMIESGAINADLWVEHLWPEMATEGFQITVRVKDENQEKIYGYIHERFFLDIAFANHDRIIIGIIPNESNIENSSSFEGFLNFAPFFTREKYVFDEMHPFCCSLFFSQENDLIKVSYSNGMNNTLIEFYK